MSYTCIFASIYAHTQREREAETETETLKNKDTEKQYDSKFIQYFYDETK